MNIEQDLANLAESARTNQDLEKFALMVENALETLIDNQSTPELYRWVLKAAVEVVNVISAYSNGSYIQLSDYTLDATQSSVNRLLTQATYQLKGLVQVDFEKMQAAEFMALRSGLRRISIPFIADKYNILWLPEWAASAIKAYNTSGGYADLKLWKYLNKMKPKPDNTEVFTASHGDTEIGPKVKRKKRKKSPRLQHRMGVR